MKDFAAIDFETANGKRTSVCSVGVVVVRGGEVVDTFYRLIRPRPNSYTQWTTAVHGLTYDDTMEAEKVGKDKFLEEIVPEWLQKAKANGRIVD